MYCVLNSHTISSSYHTVINKQRCSSWPYTTTETLEKRIIFVVSSVHQIEQSGNCMFHLP